LTISLSRPFRVACIACALIVVAKPGRAQVSSIQGFVGDAVSGERLPYATVALIGTSLGTKTNIEGVFTLQQIPAAVCSLQVRYIGYLPAVIRVDARTPVIGLSIKLKQTVIAGQEVTVLAEQETRTLKAQKDPGLVSISPAELAALPNIGEVDIFRSLQLLPGVSGTNDASSGLYVRGGAPDQNLVLFDGMTIHHVDHFYGFFSAFNVDAVKDVQFYKGGFPAKYGGALSSVVDMTGKTGDQSHMRGGLGVNIMSAHGEIEVPLGGHGSILATARSTYGDSPLAESIYKYLTGSEETGTTSGFGGGGGRRPPGFANAMVEQQIPLPSFYDGNFKATYYLTPTDVVAASLYLSNDGLDKSQDQSFASTTEKTEQGNLGFSGRWFHQWAPTLFTNLVAASSRYVSTYTFGVNVTDSASLRTPRGGMGTDEANSISDLSVRMDNEWQAAPEHTVGFGVQMASTRTSYSLTLADPFRGGSAAVVERSQRGIQAAAYAQDEWAISSLFSTTVGIRATYFQPTAQTYLDPRWSARFSLTDQWSVKGAYGIYRQFLNRIVNESITEGSRDFWLLTDGTLQPGRSDHYVLGTSWETGDILLDVECYYKTMSGLVEFSQRFRRAAEDLYTFATGTGTSRGVELLLQKKYGVFSGWASYTLSKTDYTFPVIDLGTTFPAAQDERHELKLVTAVTLSDWSFGANWIYGSGKPYTAPVSQYVVQLLDGSAMTYVHVGAKNSFRLPPYHRLDITASHIFGRGTGTEFTLGLSVFNVYNRKNLSYMTYDLSTQPATITEVASLGITPTIFLQLNLH
jgi:ferric enterobactin receptor